MFSIRKSSAFFPTSLCGVLVFDSVSRRLLRLRLLLRRLRLSSLSTTSFHIPSLSTTIFHTSSFTPSLSTTIFHTSSFTHHLRQPPSFTHHLCQPPSHTHHLSHIIFHTPSLRQPPSFTHHLCQPPSHTHHLSHTIFVNHHLSHTIFHTPSLSTTIFHTPSLSTTIFHTPSFTHHLCQPPSFTRHRSHTTIFRLRGRRGTWRHLPSFGVAGVALGVIYLRLAWQAWHLLHLVALGRRWSPLVAVGRRRGAARLCLAGVAFGDIYLCWRGRCGTWRHLPVLAWQAWHLETSTCVGVAGVALGDIYLRLAWQAWHLETSTFVSRGRRGTWRHLPAFHVAGVAVGDIYLGFTWHAWHLESSTCALRGRRGTWRHLRALGVAGVALVALGGALGRRWSPLVARGAAPVCVASVALGDIYFRFTWQAWHLVTSTFALRGRRGTWRHPPSFCVAGVALGDIHLRFVTHHLCHTQLRHTPSFTPHCLSHTQLRFTFRSSATSSFVFPSFPVPATTFGAHYWKKLPCGVIRSFNYGYKKKNSPERSPRPWISRLSHGHPWVIHDDWMI